MKDYSVELTNLRDAGRVFAIAEAVGGRVDIRGRVVTFDQQTYDQLRAHHDAGGSYGISEGMDRFLWLDGNEYNVREVR